VSQGDFGDGKILALNIKEDGLLAKLLPLLASGPPLPDGAFFFDMSVPQLVQFVRVGLPVALRLSEYETPASLTEFHLVDPGHIWIDGFHDEWFVENTEVERLCETRCGIIVSPEIHGRDPRATWDWVYEARARGVDLGICTDQPLDFLAWGG
jgi:hypothetical protein